MSFRPINRQTDYLFPPSMNNWLPEKHLARFVVETVEEFDLTRFVSAYRSTGSASYHPSLLLSLLIYGYATGLFASRKIERATTRLPSATLPPTPIRIMTPLPLSDDAFSSFL
ncbi:hypothetical protein W03_24710 [Nitrosomonas sp. PY1]|jgi:transposase|nr:hypothetical protein W03_24710 [Nitrosomonas sp. PY1]